MPSLLPYAHGWRQALRRRTPFSALRTCPATPPEEAASTKTEEAKRQTFERSAAELASLMPKWQARWEAAHHKRPQLPPGDDSPSSKAKAKAYVLPMFPYPSGELHLGHLRVYTISDVLARFKRMQGCKVTHPIGWDAFGLPAENAAMARGIHPEKWTLHNIQTMKTQMATMGGKWDWDKEFRTCDPDFYKHTQRIFLMLHERGLAYQAESLVNYDPVDMTVLANEQVDANGCSWRSGAKVEKKMLKQWFLRIKAFQQELLRDLDALAENGNWPERVLTMQRNWLGRSEGMKLWFQVNAIHYGLQPTDIEVFTTRPDTLFGVQYLALSLKHPFVQLISQSDPDLRAFLDRAQTLPPDSKEGYRLRGVEAMNPVSKLSPTPDPSIPVYVAPYVLDDYGSGAVMGVPGHDARDHAFWRANTNHLPIMQVITSDPGTVPEPLLAGSDNDTPMLSTGFIASNISLVTSKAFPCGGLPSDEAAAELVKCMDHNSIWNEKTENWRLRDWLISRQRYWGTPIPIIHCSSCGPVPVPLEDLPVRLPNLPDESFQGNAGNPLANDPEWKKTACPKCGSAAERETDTMDTFMDSSWYFFRFLDPKRADSPIRPREANNGMQVDVYIGGVEHAILHLLYARFISKFLATTPLWPNGATVHGEPFKKLITQGMVHGKTYSDPETGRFLRPTEVDTSNPKAPIIKATGVTPNISFEKMSKSKYNGVNPVTTIQKYGADVTRAHLLFQAAVSDVLEWDEEPITGVQRWLIRVLRLSTGFFISPQTEKTFKPPHNFDANFIDLLSGFRNMGVLKKAPNARPGAYKTPEEELLAALKPEETDLWAKVQETIASVTKSYSETCSLNTVISDLMGLTNAIWDVGETSVTSIYLRYVAVLHLLRMLAPVAPAVAEEGWQNLISKTSVRIRTNTEHPFRYEGKPGVFAFGFPKAEEDILAKLRLTNQCVFMVDGKKKFETAIRKPPAHLGTVGEVGEVERYVLKVLAETEAGKEWFGDEGKLWKVAREMRERGGEENRMGEDVDIMEDEAFELIPRGWRVKIVGRGKLVNVFSPKKAKTPEEKPAAGVEI
ncbi:leucyl-tRNA synthetase [Clohesyomyces aquaticus]|uniref:leucine--tRNA ligase n=1 Tax=Clohesyomyces aquaticus TaxID=1231657 RepID=A0A1Y1Z3P9_9PLEO|nr:leucyl-tRNA synthetase [Clohesyomyces aquaticus]